MKEGKNRRISRRRVVKSFLIIVHASLTPLRSLWSSPSHSSLCYARAMTIPLSSALQMFEFNAFLRTSAKRVSFFSVELKEIP